MDCLFEQNVSQNTALSAELLHISILGYYEANKGISGLKFPLSFLVLPMVFQRRITDALYTKQKPGCLYKAIIDNREIPVGLQHRVELFYEKTMCALSLGICSELFTLHYQTGEFLPKRKTALNIKHGENVKHMRSAAMRLGQTFCEMTVEEITQILKVVF